MAGFTNVAAAALILTSILGGANAGTAPNQVPQNSDILGEYVQEVDKDTQALQKEMTGIVNVFVDDTLKEVDAMLQDPNVSGEDFGNYMEKRAEDFADAMEAAGEAYGHSQENKGDAFGEKFDDDTAAAVVNVTTNILKRFWR